MRKFLDAVTVTGADDSFSVEWMLGLSEKFPSTEWGILLSASSMGKPRFPSVTWLIALLAAKRAHPKIRLSGHLCGLWVRQFCAGDTSFAEPGSAIGELFGAFDRVQLNFHAIAHKVDVPAMVEAMRRFPGKQFILQLDGVNDHVLEQVRAAGMDAVGLFDLSGGAGRLPESWPVRDCYAGFAGGLGPDNVEAQLALIDPCAPKGAWIDAETRLRTDDDQRLDPVLVQRFLELAAAWVKVEAKFLHLPADVNPLPEDAVFGLFEQAFDARVYGARRPESFTLPFSKFQALMVTLDAANQNVGRLRHWVANAGANSRKPDMESRVLFLAASTAVDLMLGSSDDFDAARSLLTIAVNEVALSRAGKLDLDMAAWAARESDIQSGKPILRDLMGRHGYDFKGHPLQVGGIQGAEASSQAVDPNADGGGVRS